MENEFWLICPSENVVRIERMDTMTSSRAAQLQQLYETEHNQQQIQIHGQIHINAVLAGIMIPQYVQPETSQEQQPNSHRHKTNQHKNQQAEQKIVVAHVDNVPSVPVNVDGFVPSQFEASCGSSYLDAMTRLSFHEQKLSHKYVDEYKEQEVDHQFPHPSEYKSLEDESSMKMKSICVPHENEHHSVEFDSKRN
jgi:hypothetical protein